MRPVYTTVAECDLGNDRWARLEKMKEFGRKEEWCVAEVRHGAVTWVEIYATKRAAMARYDDMCARLEAMP